MSSGVTYVNNKPYNYQNGRVTNPLPIGKLSQERKDYDQAQRTAALAHQMNQPIPTKAAKAAKAAPAVLNPEQIAARKAAKAAKVAAFKAQKAAKIAAKRQ